VIQKTIHMTYKVARRVVIAVIGSTVFALGIVMIVAPGPALIVIPVGLAILGLEFAWARLWLKHLRRTISRYFANGRTRRADGHRDRVSREAVTARLSAKRKAPES
jgi:tellurite resistance protein TerC